ncbi:unnamed protein product [Durusdinium trenchii]|uniref:Uncharacterized protein n=1 Tax=Durusdinium trenchii TaxID=1381693 RepID=A0ABP0SSZ4_9DINO
MASLARGNGADSGGEDLEVRRQEQLRLEERLQLRLAELRGDRAPPSAPAETPEPVEPKAVRPEGSWRLEETLERVARLELRCSSVPRMHSQLENLSERLSASVKNVDEHLAVLRSQLRTLQERSETQRTKLHDELFAELSRRIDVFVQQRFTLLLEELLPSALAARLDAAEPSPALRRAEETAKRVSILAESNSSTLEQLKVLQASLELGLASELAGVHEDIDQGLRRLQWEFAAAEQRGREAIEERAAAALECEKARAQELLAVELKAAQAESTMLSGLLKEEQSEQSERSRRHMESFFAEQHAASHRQESTYNEILRLESRVELSMAKLEKHEQSLEDLDRTSSPPPRAAALEAAEGFRPEILVLAQEAGDRTLLQARSYCEEAQAAKNSTQELFGQLKRFVAEKQEALVLCYRELAQVAVTLAVRASGAVRPSPSLAEEEVIRELTTVIQKQLKSEEPHRLFWASQAIASSSSLGPLLERLRSTLASLEMPLDEEADLPSGSEGCWQEASPSSSLHVAVESYVPKPPSLVISWPVPDAGDGTAVADGA